MVDRKQNITESIDISDKLPIETVDLEIQKFVYTPTIEEQVTSVFKTINSTKAAVRLIQLDCTSESKTENIDFELGMLSDTISNRPIRKKSLDHRDLYTPTKGFEKNRPKKRKLITTRTLEYQETVIDPNSIQYYSDGNLLIRPVQEQRGSPKLTKFTKKLSFTLLNDKGKSKFYEGGIFDSKLSRIGFLVDVDETHQKGQRYMWRGDTGTNQKFWVGKKNSKQLTSLFRAFASHHSYRSEACTLKELQGYVNKDKQVHEYQNEMLLGYNKKSIKSLFSTKNTIEQRLGLLYSYYYIKTKSEELAALQKIKDKTLDQEIRLRTDKKFSIPEKIKDYSSIDVPLMIIDGKNNPIEYTQSQMLHDIEFAINIYKYSLYEQPCSPLKDVQKTTIKEFENLIKLLDLSVTINSSAEDLSKEILLKINPRNNIVKSIMTF